MIIFGGAGEGQDNIFSDTWAFSVEKKQWEKMKTEETETPPARWEHSAVYDSANKQMIISGGLGPWTSNFWDTWVLDIEKKQWEEIGTEEAPSSRGVESQDMLLKYGHLTYGQRYWKGKKRHGKN